MNQACPLREGHILTGTLFSEPMRVETVRPNGPGTWQVGLVGLQTERYRRVTLTADDIGKLTVLQSGFRYTGDARVLRLGMQVCPLGGAWAQVGT